MSKSRRVLKWKTNWMPKGAKRCDSKRSRARRRDAMSHDKFDSLPELERLRDRADPWSWD